MDLDKEKIQAFCKKHHVASLALFGSVLTFNFNNQSDIDFLVKFDREHIPSLFGLVSMEDELSEIVGRKADLKTANELSPYFRDEVLAQAKEIYVEP